MSAPFIDLPLGSRSVEVEHRADGAILMRSTEPLGPYPRVLTEPFFAAAARHPGRLFIAERDGPGWRRLTYAEAATAIRSLAQALLDRGLSAERPLAILSAGSINHALMALAATHAGIPFVPVTPAYSLLASDFGKLDHVLTLVTPGLVFVEDHAAFARALAGRTGFETVAATGGATPLSGLLATTPTPALDAAHAAIRPDDMNKVLFTSGSMGPPKGVINTHRMVCANQRQMVQSIPAIAAEPPEFLSWLPWHHCSGGNMILGMIACHGGTLWIDEGRPVPALMGKTIENLRGLSPTAYFSAPSGYGELIRHLGEDAALRDSFFRRLKFFYYSGATMPDDIVAKMDALAVSTVGGRIPFFSNYGATETAPFALAVNWPDSRSGLAGLPAPGVELKLAPFEGGWEARAKGPNVTPGYFRQPEATAKAFDDEGFYRYGDALAAIEPGDLSQGLTFAGRIGENFKLASGTWVSVAGLREALMTAAGGLVRDAVICGEGRAEVGALVFPDERADPAAVRAALAQALDKVAAAATGSSTFVARAMLMDSPPDPAQGELTDKGTVSQKTVLRTRAAAVARLYADPASAEVLRAGANAAIV